MSDETPDPTPEGDDTWLTPEEFEVRQVLSFLVIEVGEAVALYVKDADGLSAIIGKLEAERQRILVTEAVEA